MLLIIRGSELSGSVFDSGEMYMSTAPPSWRFLLCHQSRVRRPVVPGTESVRDSTRRDSGRRERGNARRGKDSAQLIGITFEFRGESQALHVVYRKREQTPSAASRRLYQRTGADSSEGFVGHYQFADGLYLGASESHLAVVVALSIQLIRDAIVEKK